jgi:hypothetical protein
MNDTFLAFLSSQILPPFGAACAVAFFLAILSAFWRPLWDLTARVALFAFSMLPGVGLVPAAVLDLVYQDKAALAMQGVVLFLSAPLAIWGSALPSD